MLTACCVLCAVRGAIRAPAGTVFEAGFHRSCSGVRDVAHTNALAHVVAPGATGDAFDFVRGVHAYGCLLRESGRVRIALAAWGLRAACVLCAVRQGVSALGGTFLNAVFQRGFRGVEERGHTRALACVGAFPRAGFDVRARVLRECCPAIWRSAGGPVPVERGCRAQGFLRTPRTPGRSVRLSHARVPTPAAAGIRLRDRKGQHAASSCNTQRPTHARRLRPFNSAALTRLAVGMCTACVRFIEPCRA